MAAGVVRSDAVMACSRPTPTVSTSDSRRVQSSNAANRSMSRLDAADVVSSGGRPVMAAAVNRPATGHPLTSHTTTPAARANSTRVRADRSVLGVVPKPAARVP